MELLLWLNFFTPVICIWRKRNGIRQKRTYSCSKLPFYYLTANKRRDVFHNSGPLAPLRFNYTWGGTLISVDLLNTPMKHNFYNRLIFGGAYIQGNLYTQNHFSVSILIGLYTRNFYLGDLRSKFYASNQNVSIRQGSVFGPFVI